MEGRLCGHPCSSHSGFRTAAAIPEAVTPAADEHDLLYHRFMWHIAEIADALESGLNDEFARVDTEQAVYGLDALEEVALHPILARCLTDAGYGVHREQRYPADRRRRRISEGERCDFALTPDGRTLTQEESRATLFEPDDAVEFEDAFWLECKCVSQFLPGGPNRSYAAQLLTPVRKDVKKLSKEPGILHGGMLLVMFTATREVAEHDLAAWQDRALQHAMPIESPAIRHIPINDRIGNAHCCVAVFRVRHL